MSSWPHSPPHKTKEHGIYMVTAGTYLKEHFFRSHSSLSLLHDTLLNYANEHGWELHAWAVFSNHYHFIARSPNDPSNLSRWIAKLHQFTASEINKIDNCPNRKVWYQYWDSHITMHPSYLARLNYVHQNPVKHKLVTSAREYPWCSAGNFEQKAKSSFVKTVYSFDASKVKISDEF